MAIGGHGGLMGPRPPSRSNPCLLCSFFDEGLDHGPGGPQNHLARAAIDRHHFTRPDPPSDVVKADYGWQANRARDDSRMRRETARISCKCEHAFEVEFGHGGGPDILGDDDDVLVKFREFEPGMAREDRQQPDRYVLDIGGAFSEVWVLDLAVNGCYTIGDFPDGPFSAYLAVPDFALQLGEEFLVLEHEQVYVQYIGLLRSQSFGQPFLDLFQLCAGFAKAFTQPLYFSPHATGRDFDVVELVPSFFVQPEDITDRDPAGCGESFELD